MKDILLLGGGGFLGTALAQRFCRENRQIHIVSRRPVAETGLKPVSASPCAVYQGSLDNRLILDKVLPKCSTIFHLASTTTPGDSVNQPVREAEHNILPTLRFLEILNNYEHIHLIFISSGGTVYGNPEKVPADEDYRVSPRSYHGAGKAAIEAFLNAFSCPPLRNVTILRPTNLYGPGQPKRKGFGVIRTMLEHLRYDTVMEIWGDGETVRDFLYIDDMTEVCNRLAVMTPLAGTFNVGYSKAYSLNQLIEIIQRVCEKKLQVMYRPVRKVDVHKVILDCSKIQAALEWKPRISLEDGIRLTWEWQQNQ